VNRALKRRVVITGLGAITPLATGVEESWRKLCQGNSGVARITKFDTSGFNVQIAAELKDFHPEDFLDKKKIRRTDPFIQYALVAARMAINDAGFTINGNNASRVGEC
jgi:3-oxoacyl-[acyl-carrier-protein] synthase II